jgi:leucyl/phenylalanyl-tRNA--protein transferase
MAHDVEGLQNWAFAEKPPPRSDLQRPSAELLLWAYGHGVFPMGDPDTGRIDWFSPDPRGIIPLNQFHVPKNLAREVRKGRFDVRFDTAFEQVMRGCAIDRNHLNRSWIDETIIHAYCQLHRHGFAHSVEAWLADELVGGLYGVHIGGAFFGESMFNRSDLGGTNSSKICLVHLVARLRHRGFILLDTQFWNEHLDQFGCLEISADQYLRQLTNAIRVKITWGGTEADLRSQAG